MMPFPSHRRSNVAPSRLQLALACAAAVFSTQCRVRTIAVPVPADGNAHDCNIFCIYDSMHPDTPPSEGDLEFGRPLLVAFVMSSTGATPGCEVGFNDVCFAEPDSTLAAEQDCEAHAVSGAAPMQVILNVFDGGLYTCRAECLDVNMMPLMNPAAMEDNLLLRTEFGNMESRDCFSGQTFGDVQVECTFRFAEWETDLRTSGVLAVTDFCNNFLDVTFPAPLGCRLPDGGPRAWDCFFFTDPVDLVPSEALDCVSTGSTGHDTVCQGTPVRNTDRKFEIDTTASFVNVFQPDETTPSGASCPRALVGSTSLAGHIWLDGGFCPGETCPALLGDFDWATTATLDLGAICGGMELGDLALVRLRAADAFDLSAAPDGPTTNVVTLEPGDFAAALSFVNGDGVSGLEIENALPATAILDAATERVVFDLSFAQDLVVTTREFEVHLEAAVVNHRPVADAGPDRTAACGESVTLTSFSTDPDGPGDLVALSWAAVDAGTGDLKPRGTGSSLTVQVIETTEFVLTIVDAAGTTDQDSVVVALPPFEPVAIESVTVAPECLWPPNHSYVPFRLGTDLVVTTSGGVCGARLPRVRIAGVDSDEPDNGAGDGNTTNDGVFTRGALCVRSERSGDGDGRVYTVSVEAVDVLGNTAVATVPIAVPHDQRGPDRCGSLPTFVGDDDPRCTFGARAPAAADPSSTGSAAAGPPGGRACSIAVLGASGGGSAAGAPAFALLVLVVACGRVRKTLRGARPRVGQPTRPALRGCDRRSACLARSSSRGKDLMRGLAGLPDLPDLPATGMRRWGTSAGVSSAGVREM